MYSHLTPAVVAEQTADHVRSAALDAEGRGAVSPETDGGRTRRVRWLHARPNRQAAHA
jgi:hypothetical protein